MDDTGAVIAWDYLLISLGCTQQQSGFIMNTGEVGSVLVCRSQEARFCLRHIIWENKCV